MKVGERFFCLAECCSSTRFRQQVKPREGRTALRVRGSYGIRTRRRFLYGLLSGFCITRKKTREGGAAVGGAGKHGPVLSSALRVLRTASHGFVRLRTALYGFVRLRAASCGFGWSFGPWFARCSYGGLGRGGCWGVVPFLGSATVRGEPF